MDETSPTADPVDETVYAERPERVLGRDAWFCFGAAVLLALGITGVRGRTILTVDFAVTLGAAIVLVPVLTGLLAPRGVTLAARLDDLRYVDPRDLRPFPRRHLAAQLLLATLAMPAVLAVLVAIVVITAVFIRDQRDDGSGEGVFAGVMGIFLAPPPGRDAVERELSRRAATARFEAGVAGVREGREWAERGRLLRKPVLVYR